jgi:hypothetical protein
VRMVVDGLDGKGGAQGRGSRRMGLGPRGELVVGNIGGRRETSCSQQKPKVMPIQSHNSKVLGITRRI